MCVNPVKMFPDSEIYRAFYQGHTLLHGQTLADMVYMCDGGCDKFETVHIFLKFKNVGCVLANCKNPSIANANPVKIVLGSLTFLTFSFLPNTPLWTNLSWQVETWAEFSTLEDAVCMTCTNHGAHTIRA
jgi:hypothetical protein